MKYRVEGVYRQSGEPYDGEIEAPSWNDLHDLARELGIDIVRANSSDLHAEKRVRNLRRATAMGLRGMGEARRAERIGRVAEGRHVQWVRLTGSSELSMIVVVAIGVFLGMLAFSCCGGGMVISGLAGAFSEAANP